MADLAAFFTALAAACTRVLMLDYDGTLAPFQVQRDLAFPYAGVREILGRIQIECQTHLVIVSGRPAADLPSLLQLPRPLEIFGSHGWERQRVGQIVRIAALPAASGEALGAARTWLENAGLQDHCEVKPASVAVHWRGVSSQERRRIADLARQGWQPLLNKADLELLEFSGGLEIRVPGRDKGVAVRTVLADHGPDCVAAYLGDDATDEDAFGAIRGLGLGVLVSEQDRASQATHRLAPPEELLAFLTRWWEVCRTAAI